MNANDTAQRGRVFSLPIRRPSLVLSERRVNSPESWDNCFSQLPNYWAFRFLETIIGIFGVCLGLLGTGMLAIIAKAIKIPE